MNIHASIATSRLSTHDVRLQIVKKILEIVSNPKLHIPSHSSLLIWSLLNMSLSTSACFFYFLIFSCFLFLRSKFFSKKIRNKFLKTLMMRWHPYKNYLCLNITRWDYPTISVHNVLNRRMHAVRDWSFPVFSVLSLLNLLLASLPQESENLEIFLKPISPRENELAHSLLML